MNKPLAFVVEDERDLAELYEEAIKDAGFEVEVMDNGARAIGRLAEATRKPSLIVLDLNLPLVSGENTLRQVRDTVMDNPDTRVMVVSADVKRAELLHDQADLVLIKPVTYSQLKELAQRLVPAAKKYELSDDPSDADTQRINRIDLKKDAEDDASTGEDGEDSEDGDTGEVKSGDGDSKD